MFEFTEVEQVADTDHLKNIISCYQLLGFKTAIDDFGSGYSGLNLLAEFQTNIVKLDMDLVRNINDDPIRQKIVSHVLAMMNDLAITTLAEGIETAAEYQWLKQAGVRLFQGYYFAKPALENLPQVDFNLC